MSLAANHCDCQWRAEFDYHNVIISSGHIAPGCHVAVINIKVFIGPESADISFI